MIVRVIITQLPQLNMLPMLPVSVTLYYSGLMTMSLTTGRASNDRASNVHLSVSSTGSNELTSDRWSFTLSLPIVSHDYLLLTMTRLSVVSVISSTSADAISLLIDADRISLYVALDSCFSIYLLPNRVAIYVLYRSNYLYA